MSNLVPIVTPINNAEGAAIGIVPTATFSQSIDNGSISTSSCFLVEIPTHSEDNLDIFLANAALGSIIPAQVVSQRINLLDENFYTGLDFGTDIDSGQKYRSRIVLKPNNLLKPNTTFAGLLSKDISLLSIFDPEPNGGNSGTGTLLASGIYEGTASDTYTITIAVSGDKNTAKYIWTRASDGKTSVMIEARARFIQIDKGIEIKFEDGTYTIGDSFIIRTILSDKQQDIFSWTFSTGPSDYKVPDDEKSGDLLDIPVGGSSIISNDSLSIVSIDPENGTSLVKIPRKSSLIIGDVFIITELYTSLFNAYTIEMVDGATAGSEVVSLIGSDILITIESGVSTAQQVVDAFNASILVASDFQASTTIGTTVQVTQVKKSFSKGVNATVITILFNKNLNPASIANKIKINSSPIYPSGPIEDLIFSTSVSGKQLTITLEEQE